MSNTVESIAAWKTAQEENGMSNMTEPIASWKTAQEENGMSSTMESIAAWKAAQAQGLLPWCPRCGRDTMKPDLLTNALSRKADIMICDDCGTKQALLAFLGQDDELSHWAIFWGDRGQTKPDNGHWNE